MLKTFTKILIVLVITYLILKVKVAIAVAPERTLEDYTVKELIAYFADKYDVSEEQMLRTSFCESSHNTNAIGDHGHSFGMWQIHLPSHPEITKEQALDPIFSTEWSAKEFAEGHQRQWTCWRNLYN